MYTAQTTKERIKKLCKNKKINMEQMLKECNLGVNAIRQINDNKGMASFSLGKIADYLNCSTDYLLGRTDVSYVTLEAKDEMEIEMLRVFKSLDFADKMEIMNTIIEKTKK